MMTPELQVLSFAILLQAIQFLLMSITANLDLGIRKSLSARDESHLGGPLSSQLSDKPARLFRALNNHFEALILYTAAVVVLVLVRVRLRDCALSRDDCACGSSCFLLRFRLVVAAKTRMVVEAARAAARRDRVDRLCACPSSTCWTRPAASSTTA